MNFSIFWWKSEFVWIVNRIWFWRILKSSRIWQFRKWNFKHWKISLNWRSLRVKNRNKQVIKVSILIVIERKNKKRNCIDVSGISLWTHIHPYAHFRVIQETSTNFEWTSDFVRFLHRLAFPYWYISLPD